MDGGITGHTGIIYTLTANRTYRISVNHLEDWLVLLRAIHGDAKEDEAKNLLESVAYIKFHQLYLSDRGLIFFLSLFQLPRNQHWLPAKENFDCHFITSSKRDTTS